MKTGQLNKKILNFSLFFVAAIIWLFSDLIVREVHAAVAIVGTTTSAAGSGASSLTITSHTVPTGSNRLLIVTCMLDNRSSNQVTSIDIGTATADMTKIRSDTDPSASKAHTEIWYKLAPVEQTANIVVNFAGTPSGKPYACGAMNFTGVDQTTPYDGTGVGATGLNQAATVNVTTSATNDLVLDVVAGYKATNPNTVGANQTAQWQNGISGTEWGGSSTEAGAAGTITMSWTISGTGAIWAMSAININAGAADNVTVSTSGTQTADLTRGSTNNYLGGTFVITENTGSRNVTGITITENGTVDALNNLDNIKLKYDLDTTAPYDCASESYASGDTQFGATDTTGFSAANGTSAFTATVGISTTSTMCVYVELDVTTGATAAQTIEVEISNPSTDVTVSAGTVGPTSAVALSGATTIQDPGTIMSPVVDYDWFNGASAWNEVYWSEDETSGTVMVQVFYSNCATIIPDADLANNSTGFATSPIDISSLSTVTYNEICIRATLTDSAGGSPVLGDWGITVPEYTWLFFGIGPLLPGIIGRIKRRKGNRN